MLPPGASVDDLQANAAARLFDVPPSGSTITCTLASGSTLLLDTQTGAYTYRPVDGATLDAFVVASSDGRQGSKLILTFDARDPLDRDGINANVEGALASLVTGGLGDLNGDGIADANQNAVATLAWNTVDRFASAIADPAAFAERSANLASVISLWIALPGDNDAVDDSAQLTGVKVLDPNTLAGGKPAGAAWDPLQFSIEPLQSMGLVDSDTTRDGLQVTIRIDVSRSGVAEGEFTRYMKFVSAEALQQYADSGLSLRDLDGNLITAAGWYDFTQRETGGDGARYVYENGMLQAIVITLTDNAFGDNDARAGYLKDPGVPVGQDGRDVSPPTDPGSTDGPEDGPTDPGPTDPPPNEPDPDADTDPGPGPAPGTAVPPPPPVTGMPPVLPARPDPGLLPPPTQSFGGVSPFGSPLSSLFGDPAPGRNAAVDGLYRWAADDADLDADEAGDDAVERLASVLDAASEPGGLPAWMAHFDLYTDQDDWRTAVIPAEAPALMVFRGMPDQFVEGGRDGRFTVPWDTFVHTKPGAQVLLQAALANGGKLPDWLRFDARSGVFVAAPSTDFRGELAIRLTARDSEGREATVLFRFRVGDAVRSAPERAAGEPAATAKSGRAGLGDKLRMARG